MAGKDSDGRLPGNLVLLLIGILFILSGVVVEKTVIPKHQAITSFEGGALVQTGRETVVVRRVENEEKWSDMLILLAKELGVALIVAWVVSAGIERQARERDNVEAEKRRKEIAQDVILGVYGLSHKPAYVKRVIETTLQSPIVRDEIDLDYALRRLTPAEMIALGVTDPNRFVALDMISAYTFRNVTSSSKNLPIRFSIAVRQGKLRDFAQVTSVTLAGRPLSAADIKAGLPANADDYEKNYCWNRTIPGNGTLHVSIEAVTIKELSDNEVWGSFFATTDEFKITTRAIVGMAFGVRALTGSPLERASFSPEHGHGIWKINGPVLPQDSVTFWWRTAEDDGNASEPVPDGLA